MLLLAIILSRDEPITILIGFIIWIIPIAAISFLLIYPTLNLISQIRILSISFFLEEFESGIFFLRICSLWIGIASMRYFIKSTKKRDYLNNKSYETLKDLKELSKRKSEYDFYLVIRYQYTFYAILLIFLWGFLIFQIKTIITIILNWGIFFIIDDWEIIFRYSELLKGRILRSHHYRIIFFDILLYICLAITLFIDSNLIFAIISVIIIGLFLLIVLSSYIL